MRIILPKIEILTPISDGGVEELKQIERAARTCYKSEGKITENGESAKKMVNILISKGHEAMLEHSQLSVKFITDRGVSHELVRHRLASFAQESTRWCDYTNDGKFEGGLTFILPYEFNAAFMKNDDIRDEFSAFMQTAETCARTAYSKHLRFETIMGIPGFNEWIAAMFRAEEYYDFMREKGCTPQLARSVLPNSLKTEIVVTTNYREWRNILKLRTAKDAHPDMRSLMNELLKELKKRIPLIFDDIPIDWDI